MTRKLFCYRQGWPDRPQAPNQANNTGRGTLGELNVDRARKSAIGQQSSEITSDSPKRRTRHC
ncbi:hypothetical protein [Microcoleus sp.]|uniref:hypothetical protein n=1 Tax=Microcoleus sp. TaxID=44472 RepID=UPI0035944D2A